MQITTMNVVQERTRKTILKSRIAIALLAATIVTVGMAVVPMLVATPAGTSLGIQTAHAEMGFGDKKTTQAGLSMIGISTKPAYA